MCVVGCWLGRSWWARFNGIFIWQDLDSECGRYWILIDLLKIQINSPQKKPGFWKEKISLRWWWTLELKAHHSIQCMHDCLSYLAVQKNGHIHCKTMFTCWVPLFRIGFALGPKAKATLVQHLIRSCMQAIHSCSLVDSWPAICKGNPPPPTYSYS